VGEMLETRDERRENIEARGKKQVARSKRQEARNKRQEARDKKRETKKNGYRKRNTRSEKQKTRAKILLGLYYYVPGIKSNETNANFNYFIFQSQNNIISKTTFPLL
jgi:hypothetical protein